MFFKEDKNNRPDKFKGWDFPKGSYGFIIGAIILLGVVGLDLIGFF